jgi:hypothetical protein
MSLTNLVTFSVVSVFLTMAISMETKDQSFSIHLCSVQDEIAEMCPNSDIQIIERLNCTANEVYNSTNVLECTPNLISEKGEAILVLNIKGQSYKCNPKLSQNSSSYPINMASYEVEYSNCELLSNKGPLKDGYYYRSASRRMEAACNISLNLYSVLFI